MCPLNQIAYSVVVLNCFDLALLDIKHNIDHTFYIAEIPVPDDRTLKVFYMLL